MTDPMRGPQSREERLVHLTIPFYGGKHPRLFEIERRCMDRDGKVLAYLDAHLPQGLVLDVGAGSGYYAALLGNETRLVIPLEPDPAMIDLEKPLVWAWGAAQDLPFHTGTFQAAYATWAFFLAGITALEEGLREVNRVVRPGGLIIIVDNAGGDAFTALAPEDLAADRNWWRAHGFRDTILETSFRFDSAEEANELLSFYFGEAVAAENRQTEIGYRVAVFEKEATSPSAG
jgi:SAM-dependent methyltransferase